MDRLTARLTADRSYPKGVATLVDHDGRAVVDTVLTGPVDPKADPLILTLAEVQTQAVRSQPGYDGQQGGGAAVLGILAGFGGSRLVLAVLRTPLRRVPSYFTGPR